MTPRAVRDPPKGAPILKIALAVAVLLAAGAYATYTLVGSEHLEQPDTPESASTYVCLECNHAFQLTPAAYVKLNRSGDIQVANDDGPRGRRWLRCPQCKKFSAVLADRCPKDQTAVPRQAKNGKAGRCPKCNWTSIGV